MTDEPSDADTVVIQGCDRCNGKGTILTAPPLPASVTPLSRKCPKCLGEGLVMNVHGVGQVPIQRPTEP